MSQARKDTSGAADPAEAVARVLHAKRSVLLRAYRGQLGKEDLEDCLSQAALELLVRARRKNAGLVSDAHIANALEQKLRSRICDLRRSRGGRSRIAAALACALPLAHEDERIGVEPCDPRTSTERCALDRIALEELLANARRLTPDQRRVLASRLLLDARPAEVCERFGWSMAKYQKLDQRARARLAAMCEAAAPAQDPRAAA
jgi:DNA-directed RNA polymerase specialized sigma24 family protein